MDGVDVFLFCVVGFTVVVFFILEDLEERRISCRKPEESSVTYDSEAETGKDSFFAELFNKNYDQIERESVGADGKAEKELVFESLNAASHVIEEEVAENSIPLSSEKSDFCGGILGNNEKSRDFEGGEEFFDDWEGIERTELEKIFGEAVVYVSSKNNADQINGDLNLQLYGLQQIAIEGPCHGSQPMALKVSARSKWNAWQKLGDMSRETAMEEYVNILSKAIPKWKVDGTSSSSNKLPDDEFAEATQDAGTSEDQTSTPCNESETEGQMSSNMHGIAGQSI